MARMIPLLTGDQLSAVKSRAEARFYEACRDQLSSDFVVIHSAGWLYKDARGRLKEGEADFIILTPTAGIYVVEVKGGGISFDPANGKWSSKDRNGYQHEIKDPFRQASSERHALLDQLNGSPEWRQWKGERVSLGHSVFFPDIADSANIVGPERPRELIGISVDLKSLTSWLDRLIKFWRQNGETPLGSQGVKILEKFLTKPIEVRPAFVATIDDAEVQRIRLTNNQAKVLRIIGGRTRAVISGGAGTGKTLIAVEKAKYFASNGLKTLLLCYNRPLADSLALALQDQPLLAVLDFHQLCDRRIRQAKGSTGRDLLKEAAEAYPGNSSFHLYGVQMPYALALSNELLDEKFDAIVIDEAQDFSDEYWFGIEELLKDVNKSYLYIFIDQNQEIYKRHGNLPVTEAPYHLTANCRNTIPIHRLAYNFYKGEVVDEPELQGPNAQLLAINDQDSQVKEILNTLAKWTSDDAIKPVDIVILITGQDKEMAYKALEHEASLHGVKLSFGNHARRSNQVLVDSVYRFKGLESSAVILWVGDEVFDSKETELIYVGISRAKTLLSVVASTKSIEIIKDGFQ
ncbi:NERD domain-containing protein [Polynucleobacter sp. MG-6-Vaara-E2]|uniref:NERD domain-containing protein n=1 Tax=Polynucleobacter sp. MG-6-Vaara-E2 TaxID=2576932 RepID=UPI001BFE6DD5|nr:NERD domain-containing protein [Polynucleobacter sp. MG-6-Vaara-E2]QWD96257.1 NERD domain-containing protein [Polynucleobacter sp. MG-6-Vaara-E2]